MSIPLYLWGIDLRFLSRVNLNPLASYAVMVGLETPSIAAVSVLPYLSFGLQPLFSGFFIFQMLFYGD